MSQYKILFTVRRNYYDEIVAGVKTCEIRRFTQRWNTIAETVLVRRREGTETVAVFLCGRSVHRRRVIGVEYFWSAAEALGREPSAQGKVDLGSGRVVKFTLGEVA